MAWTQFKTFAGDDFVCSDNQNLFVITSDPPVPTDHITIKLYRNSAEDARVNKNEHLTEVLTLTGNLRAECSVTDPSISIEFSGGLPEFNYVYIAEFNRYYFVRSITSVIKNIWRVDMHVDVLMSYRSGLGGLIAVIGRQEESFNPLLVDTQAIMSNRRVVSVTHYPNTWLFDTSQKPLSTSKQILLNVVGSY